jgi:hypothetical protein
MINNIFRSRSLLREQQDYQKIFNVYIFELDIEFVFWLMMI